MQINIEMRKKRIMIRIIRLISYIHQLKSLWNGSSTTISKWQHLSSLINQQKRIF